MRRIDIEGVWGAARGSELLHGEGLVWFHLTLLTAHQTHAGRQTDRPTDRPTDRQTDTDTDRHRLLLKHENIGCRHQRMWCWIPGLLSDVSQLVAGIPAFEFHRPGGSIKRVMIQFQALGSWQPGAPGVVCTGTGVGRLGIDVEMCARELSARDHGIQVS